MQPVGVCVAHYGGAGIVIIIAVAAVPIAVAIPVSIPIAATGLAGEDEVFRIEIIRVAVFHSNLTAAGEVYHRAATHCSQTQVAVVEIADVGKGAEVYLVLTDYKVFNGVITLAAGELEDIPPRAAVEFVIPTAAVYNIITLATIQLIPAGTAPQGIFTIPPIQLIIPGATV